MLHLYANSDGAFLFMHDRNIINDLGIVIPAGGTSSRFGKGSKILAELCGIPVFIWCIRSFLPAVLPDRIVMAVPEADIPVFQEISRQFLPQYPLIFAKGGATRTESVLNAMRQLTPDAGIVAVHDAARPFATESLLRECVAKCRIHGSAVAAKKVCDTVKEADPDGFVSKTVPRDLLWAVETPQVFNRKMLENAYAKAGDELASFTDDSALIEKYSGVRTFLVENRAFNLKITWPEDIGLAKAYAQSCGH